MRVMNVPGLRMTVSTRLPAMLEIATAIAELTALRERASLEEALVRMIKKQVLPACEAVRLVRLIGEPGKQHWQVQASIDKDINTVERDCVWAEWSHLPRENEFPERIAALADTSPVRMQGEAHTLIIAVDRDALSGTVLEVASPDVVSKESEALISCLIAIYRNLIDLLDYGEKDALTGLLNRKSFDGAFVRAAMAQDTPQEGAQAPNRRDAHPERTFWLAVMDIDHFKRINDSYGHLIGDEVLILIAGIMRSVFRSQDQLYRFGGEEFVILWRSPDHESARNALERFRHAVESFVFPQAGRVTVSIGFSQLRSDDTPGLAFDRADQAVYLAKAGGRNQVLSFSDLLAAGTIIETPPGAEQNIDFF